jgi:hypothetical protein
MSSTNSHPEPVYISNEAASIHPAMESVGSIIATHGHGSLVVDNGIQTPFPTGPLADLGGAFSQGNVEIVR